MQRLMITSIVAAGLAVAEEPSGRLAAAMTALRSR